MREYRCLYCRVEIDWQGEEPYFFYAAFDTYVHFSCVPAAPAADDREDRLIREEADFILREANAIKESQG